MGLPPCSEAALRNQCEETGRILPGTHKGSCKDYIDQKARESLLQKCARREILEAGAGYSMNLTQAVLPSALTW